MPATQRSAEIKPMKCHDAARTRTGKDAIAIYQVADDFYINRRNILTRNDAGLSGWLRPMAVSRFFAACAMRRYGRTDRLKLVQSNSVRSSVPRPGTHARTEYCVA